MSSPDRPLPAGLGKGGLWPAHLPRPAAPGVPSATAAAAPTAAVLPPEVSAEKWPWRGVQWTLIYVGFPAAKDTWQPFLWVLAALTMTVGNVLALRQSNVVRMFAYS